MHGSDPHTYQSFKTLSTSVQSFILTQHHFQNGNFHDILSKNTIKSRWMMGSKCRSAVIDVGGCRPYVWTTWMSYWWSETVWYIMRYHLAGTCFRRRGYYPQTLSPPGINIPRFYRRAWEWSQYPITTYFDTYVENLCIYENLCYELVWSPDTIRSLLNHLYSLFVLYVGVLSLLSFRSLPNQVMYVSNSLSHLYLYLLAIRSLLSFFTLFFFVFVFLW